MAQQFSITGKVVDEKGNQLSFVNVLLYEDEIAEPIKGAITNEDGSFEIKNLAPKPYFLSFSYIGFETQEQNISLTANLDIGEIKLLENQQVLEETVVTAKMPTIKKEAGKLVFNVENTSVSTGNTFDLLKKTPGVLVIGESIQVKFSTPVIYINGKRVYLSSAEVTSLLQNVDASIIKSIEVITNPSAKYDAEAGTVLNIITSRAISVGYKGSVNGTYEQAVFPKYSFGTAHFYKNDWLNFYGSYSFSPRKEFKEDDNYTRFFEPDETSTKSIWESYFTRTTRSKGHQANVVSDFTLNEKNTLSLAANVFISPNKNYNNTVNAQIFDAERQLDSILSTISFLENDTQNLSFNLEYKLLIGEKGASLTTSGNYIYYDNEQLQSVSTDYFLPNGDFIRTNSFYTHAHQNSNIITGQMDLATPLFLGDFEAGFKYSNIHTESRLDFFDTESGTPHLNPSLSDLFKYDEVIYANYINYVKTMGKWQVNAGLRTEFTQVNGDSRSLGIVNTQEYFELFPSGSIHYTINENNTMGISYSRSIERPKYESLNPFRYFINENNYSGGNPNLVPAIEQKLTLSYGLKNKWFLDLYYQTVKNALGALTFQDNINSTIWHSDVNFIEQFQYSFDITYLSPLTSWWYLQAATSTFYLENEFFSTASAADTYSLGKFGFQAQIYSGLTLWKEQALTSDIVFTYLTNYVFGSYIIKDQSYLSISFRKEFWNKRASLSVGVDDIFDTYNIPISSRYYNQDNSYFARTESRLFRAGFKYNFGNARLRDNSKEIRTDESERLEGK